MAPMASGKKEAPLKSLVSEDKKNDGFVMPMNAKLTIGALERLPAKVNISGAGSVCGSAASSNKSASGAIKRHCEPCSFKLFSNWPQHKTKAHGGIEVASVKCIGDWQCPKCNGKYFETFHFNIQSISRMAFLYPEWHFYIQTYIQNGISISRMAFLYPYFLAILTPNFI
jgi:hypothetical protein